MAVFKQGERVRLEDGTEASVNSFTEQETLMIYMAVNSLRENMREQRKFLPQKQYRFSMETTEGILKKIKKTLESVGIDVDDILGIDFD